MDRLGKRGQAAVTDALYFLLIVTGITIFLFGFANTYGATVDRELVKTYNVDFTTDALKTILYSSVPRDPTNSLYPQGGVPEVEIDHLLAYVKEDYADDQDLSPSTQLVLAENIKGIMAPLADNFDYLFTISTNQNDYVFFFFHKSNLQYLYDDYTPYSPGEEIPRDAIIGIPLDPATQETTEHAFFDYLCTGGNGITQNSDLKDKVNLLVSNVGDTSQSSAKLKLIKIVGNSTEEVPSQTDLVVWNSTLLFEPDPTIGGPLNIIDSPWNCVTVEDVQESLETATSP